MIMTITFVKLRHVLGFVSEYDSDTIPNKIVDSISFLV